MQFDHEKLDVYRLSIEFNRFVHSLFRQMDANTSLHSLKDQLVRSGLSIPLNIAEGNGKRTAPDRNRFFEIARGSAMESAATLDVLVVSEFCSEEMVQPGKALLHRVVSMLYKMTEYREVVREEEAEYLVEGQAGPDDVEQ